MRGAAKADSLLVLRMYPRAGLVELIGGDFLARIIHVDFYSNRRYVATTNLTASGLARSVGQHTVIRMLPFLAVPRARLTRCLCGFVTTSHE